MILKFEVCIYLAEVVKSQKETPIFGCSLNLRDDRKVYFKTLNTRLKQIEIPDNEKRAIKKHIRNTMKHKRSKDITDKKKQKKNEKEDNPYGGSDYSKQTFFKTY